jgi:hypothetical protein
MANERAGKFLARAGYEERAKDYINRAGELYEVWGAK